MKGFFSTFFVSILGIASSVQTALAQSYADDVDNIYPNPPEHTAAAEALLARINEVILFPLISLMIGVALLIFLWGAFQFVYQAGNEGAREVGRRHMLWGIIGFVIMLSALTILQIAAGTFGIQVPNN